MKYRNISETKSNNCPFIIVHLYSNSKIMFRKLTQLYKKIIM